jgi:signal transduction histidine kinase
VSLTRRLVLSYVGIVALTAAVLIAGADILLRGRLIDEARRELEREARYFEGAAEVAGAAHLDSLVHALGTATGRRLTVIDRTGAVIADSDFPHAELATLENHASRPEVKEALAGRTGTDLRRSASTGRDELKVAVPSAFGVVRISAPLPQVDAVVRRAQGAVLVSALAAVIMAAILALWFAESVSRPLLRLRDAAEAIARGERPTLDTRGRDEVGQLGRALRTVDENLSGRLADLERERAGMAALIGSMIEGVIACDARGTVTAINPAARDLLDLGSATPVPPVYQLFRQRAARDALEATLAGATTADIEIELDQRTILLSGSALKDGGAVFVVHDVTALKRLETIRRDFVANVSHELKTPLTVVRGYAETLRKDDPPPEVRAAFLDTMLANTARMQSLIDDLLDLSRIESRTWMPEPTEVAVEPLAREVWAALAGRGNAATIGFSAETSPAAGTLHADTEGVRQILTNVLDNAARYTPAGGTVRVRTAREGGMVRIDVSDTGPGIAAEHLTRIFERFYRVDPARSRELGGTGLGLAIVKHLAEAHGGRVEALSTLGHGTTIRIFLPAA